MNAIVKLKLRFTPPPGVEGAKAIIVSPLPHPQQLPDWIKKSAGYEACTSGDNPAIVEVELKKAAPKEYVESKKAAEGSPSSGSGGSESGTAEGSEKEKKGRSSK